MLVVAAEASSCSAAVDHTVLVAAAAVVVVAMMIMEVEGSSEELAAAAASLLLLLPFSLSLSLSLVTQQRCGLHHRDTCAMVLLYILLDVYIHDGACVRACMTRIEVCRHTHIAHIKNNEYSVSRSRCPTLSLSLVVSRVHAYSIYFEYGRSCFDRAGY